MFVIITEAVICSHFEQIWRLDMHDAWFTLIELRYQADWNSDGVVVKFLLAEQKARDSISNLTTTISEIGYLLLPNHKLAEIHVSPKRHKSTEQ